MSGDANTAPSAQGSRELSATELQKLVEKVYQLMLADLRIERERQGLRPASRERERR